MTAGPHASETHFWFGSDVRPLAGVLHAPPPGAIRDIGVVVCKPFGIELLCTHRAHRHLAIELANAGFATLRFDYDGTGDSSGTDDDTGRVEAWLDSVGRAVAEVKERGAVERVCVVGAGFGGLLASAFGTRAGVDSLALFGPAASGRAWLREARAFQLLKARKGDPASVSDAELVGFGFTRETSEAIRHLEAVHEGGSAPRAALIIPRDDLPGGEDRLAQRLRAFGVDVLVTRAPGFGAMMRDDPYASAVPDEAWRTIVDWLVARSTVVHVTPTPAPSRRSSPVETSTGTPLVRETLGALGGLFCVVSEPLEPPEQPTTIFLLSIGANPHLGVNRMYVAMARSWAREGFRAVRIDLRGIGDTPAAAGQQENQIYAPSVVSEVRAAMDADARAHGTTRFVLVGLCSGAYTAFHVGVADPRVAGVVLINPLTFHWREGDSLEVRTRRTLKSKRFYARAVRQRENWARLVRGDVHLGAVAAGLARRAIVATARKLSASAGASDVERGFRAMDRRGTSMLLVFGIEDGGIDVIEAYLGADARRMNDAKHFAMVTLDGPDHTFTALHWQRHLISMLTRHFVTGFTRSPRAPIAVPSRT